MLSATYYFIRIKEFSFGEVVQVLVNMQFRYFLLHSFEFLIIFTFASISLFTNIQVLKLSGYKNIITTASSRHHAQLKAIGLLFKDII